MACAFDVHARLGAGLLESSYKACLQHRLNREGLHVESEVPIDLVFDGVTVEGAYRADMIVNGKVLLELKSVERLLPIHLSQILTYIKHADLPVGLLLNLTCNASGKAFAESTTAPLTATHSPDSPDSFFPAVDYFPWKSGFLFARNAR